MFSGPPFQDSKPNGLLKKGPMVARDTQTRCRLCSDRIKRCCLDNSRGSCSEIPAETNSVGVEFTARVRRPGVISQVFSGRQFSRLKFDSWRRRSTASLCPGRGSGVCARDQGPGSARGKARSSVIDRLSEIYAQHPAIVRR